MEFIKLKPSKEDLDLRNKAKKIKRLHNKNLITHGVAYLKAYKEALKNNPSLSLINAENEISIINELIH